VEKMGEMSIFSEETTFIFFQKSEKLTNFLEEEIAEILLILG